jgi:hypothetical protein
VGSLTDKPRQQNPKHPGGHRSKKDYKNVDTGRPVKGRPGLVMVKTGGSIYVQMPKVVTAIPITNDSESDQQQEQELKQQPKNKQPVVKTDEDEDDQDDKNEDDEDQENDYIPHISRETVDGYLVSIIWHLEEYT